MKTHFSIIAPLIVSGLLATAPLTVAQEPAISIVYPNPLYYGNITFTYPTLFGGEVYGGAWQIYPGGRPICGVEVYVDGVLGEQVYVASSTFNWDPWFIDEEIQLPVSPGIASLVELSAVCYDGTGASAWASVGVWYIPPTPTVTISTPTNGQAFTNSTVTVSGVAAGGPTSPCPGVSLVQVQMNGTNGAWQTAGFQSGSWSASVSLSPGANIIYVCSENEYGLYSTNAWVVVTYNPPITVPMLGTVKQNSNVIFTWPTSASGFVLQCSPNLGLAAVWSTNLPSPVVVGGQNLVTNPMSGPLMFFRLMHP